MLFLFFLATTVFCFCFLNLVGRIDFFYICENGMIFRDRTGNFGSLHLCLRLPITPISVADQGSIITPSPGAPSAGNSSAAPGRLSSV